MQTPAKSRSTVKNTLHNWVKWTRNLGKLKEKGKALRHKQWRHLRSLAPIVPGVHPHPLQDIRGMLKDPFSPGTWFIWDGNLGFERSCNMLSLCQLGVGCRDHNIMVSHQPLLRESVSLQGPLYSHYVRWVHTGLCSNTDAWKPQPKAI